MILRTLSTTVVASVLVSSCSAQNDRPIEPGSSPAKATASTTVMALPDFPTDLSDVRKLAGYATNIFVGSVKSAEPSDEKYGTPWTAADVEIVVNLKGATKGTVRVLQQGGVRKKAETVVLLGNETLLTTGHSYILSTLSNGPGEQTLIPVWGNKPISTSDLESIKNSGDTPSGTITKLRDAIANQVPYRR